MSYWKKFMERALGEAVKLHTIPEEVKGLKHWLDNLEKMHSYGNTKDTKAAIDNIIKRLNMIRRTL